MNDWLYGQVAGSLLAQLAPSVSTPVTAFVASTRTEITRIRVTNISGATRTFRMSHQASGAFAATSAIYYDQQVLTTGPFDWGAGSPNAGISLASGETVMVRSDLTAGLSFSLYGVVQTGGR